MNKEVGKIFGPMLRLSWMNEEVKISVKASRRDILLLCHLIDRTAGTDEAKGLFPAEWTNGLKAMSVELLTRADLSEEFAQSFKDEMAGGKTVG